MSARWGLALVSVIKTFLVVCGEDGKGSHAELLRLLFTIVVHRDQQFRHASAIGKPCIPKSQDIHERDELFRVVHEHEGSRELTYRANKRLSHGGYPGCKRARI